MKKKFASLWTRVERLEEAAGNIGPNAWMHALTDAELHTHLVDTLLAIIAETTGAERREYVASLIKYEVDHRVRCVNFPSKHGRLADQLLPDPWEDLVRKQIMETMTSPSHGFREIWMEAYGNVRIETIH